MSEHSDSGGLRWGEDLRRDCQELKRLESWGLYPQGHHDLNCGLCLDAHITPPAEERA